MASSSEAGCCPPGSVGPKPSAGADEVQRVEVEGKEYFVVGSGERGVLLVPDVFGPHSGRTLRVAETLAKEGFNVLVPNLFTEWAPDPPTDGTSVMKWIPEHPYSLFESDLEGALTYLKEQRGAKVVGAMGFCWGVWAFFKLATSKDKVVCGVGCHPSLRIEHFFNGDNSADALAAATHCPMLLLPAGNDPEHVQPGGSVVKVLESLPHGGETKVVPFPDMAHGWVNRGDVKDEKISAEVERALHECAIPYLKKYVR
uniref:Dienelactone hydrolase domain-containing protein n=1 Tax=Palpitomonas bilix TaxID=652834 RepID=A0A7S3D0Y4_9EUKA